MRPAREFGAKWSFMGYGPPIGGGVSSGSAAEPMARADEAIDGPGSPDIESRLKFEYLFRTEHFGGTDRRSLP